MVLEDLHFFPESTLILIISFSEDKTSLLLFFCVISASLNFLCQVRYYGEYDVQKNCQNLWQFKKILVSLQAKQ